MIANLKTKITDVKGSRVNNRTYLWLSCLQPQYLPLYDLSQTIICRAHHLPLNDYGQERWGILRQHSRLCYSVWHQIIAILHKSYLSLKNLIFSANYDPFFVISLFVWIHRSCIPLHMKQITPLAFWVEICICREFRVVYKLSGVCSEHYLVKNNYKVGHKSPLIWIQFFVLRDLLHDRVICYIYYTLLGYRDLTWSNIFCDLSK